MPIFFISSLGKTGEIYLKMLPILSSAVEEGRQYSRLYLIMFAFLSRKVEPEGQMEPKFKIGC
jgi:hypothetical protein